MYSGHVITHLIGIWFKPLSHPVRRAGKSPFIAEDNKDVLYRTRDQDPVGSSCGFSVLPTGLQC